MTKLDSATFEIDPGRVPPLTATERSAIEALAVLPDSGIDTSDIPPLTDAQFATARRNPFLRGPHAVTVRLADDILAWLGSDADDRDAKLAAILRDAMGREAVTRRR